MKKAAKKKKKTKVHKPVRSKDVPATKEMLDRMESKLTHQMASFRLEVDARFKQVDARFNQLEAKIETVLAAVHRVGLIVEEQNARNKFVLDGYTSLNDRVEKLEKKADESL